MDLKILERKIESKNDITVDDLFDVYSENCDVKFLGKITTEIIKLLEKYNFNIDNIKTKKFIDKYELNTNNIEIRKIIDKYKLSIIQIECIFCELENNFTKNPRNIYFINYKNFEKYKTYIIENIEENMYLVMNGRDIHIQKFTHNGIFSNEINIEKIFDVEELEKMMSVKFEIFKIKNDVKKM